MMNTKTIYTSVGDPYEVDAETGRRIHSLEFDAERLKQDVEKLQAEVVEIEQDKRLSSGYKQAWIKQKQNKIVGTLDEYQGRYFSMAQREFETVMSERQELLKEQRLVDPLNQGNGVQNALAELESLAATSQSLREFEAGYDKALKNDPHLARAFQLKGSALASERFSKELGRTAFARRLNKDRLNYYENDATRASLAKVEMLYSGVTALSSVSHHFHRQVNGVSVPHLGTWARQIQELQWEISSYIARETGQAAMGDPETGSSGGVFMPTPAPYFITEG